MGKCKVQVQVRECMGKSEGKGMGIWARACVRVWAGVWARVTNASSSCNRNGHL